MNPKPDRARRSHRTALDPETILENVTDAFFALDREWRFTFVNREAERLLARSREELLGRNIWDEFTDAVGSTFDHNYRHAMETGESVQFEALYVPLGLWVEVRAYPAQDQLIVYFRDIS